MGTLAKLILMTIVGVVGPLSTDFLPLLSGVCGKEAKRDVLARLL
jgi:hypothetical protein